MTAPSATLKTDGAVEEGGSEERLPKHVAVIMDGNRRWARARGLPEAQGHAAGVEAIRPIVEHAVKRGIKVLTIYAFSRENWARAQHEVETLISLLEATIRDETPRLIEEGVCVRLAGRLDELPSVTRASIEDAIRGTAGGRQMTLNVAFNYSSRTEIVDAVRAYAAQGHDMADFDEAALASHLYTADLPEPDLLVRTGGDKRISNFLLWQAAYAELYFCDVFWPDFGPADLDAALTEYANRSRRFGR
ncbi:MAG: polyprenyl diphosphate synthase [Chloroflexota bacterium]